MIEQIDIAAPRGRDIVAQITAMVLTFNEEENLVRTLDQLTWLPRVLIVDSGSTDRTEAIARAYPNVDWLERAFDSFAGQCNWGLAQIETEWVLSLDADYMVSGELASEIQGLQPAAEVAGFSAAFIYSVFGRNLRATVYPPRVVLYRRERAVYADEGHAHRVCVKGGVESLHCKIVHDDRKSLARWIKSQTSYVQREAPYLIALPVEDLSPQDRLRRGIFFAPAVMFFYLTFVKGLAFGGWPAWYYILQRVIAESLLSLQLLTMKHRLEKAV